MPKSFLARFRFRSKFATVFPRSWRPALSENDRPSSYSESSRRAAPESERDLN